MDLTNRVSENGPTPTRTYRTSWLDVFDLVKVGLSSTFAIIVFIGIGYVVKNVAGPSAILCILIAAFIAFLVGKIDHRKTYFLNCRLIIASFLIFTLRSHDFLQKLGIFYTELNQTIVLSTIRESKQTSDEIIVGQIDDNANDTKHGVTIERLLPSHELVYVCNGEFAAFVIAWNLIMEYMVIVALISKALIIFIDALFFGSVGHLSEMIPMSWYLGEHFDVLALLIPVIMGGKLKSAPTTFSVKVPKNIFVTHFFSLSLCLRTYISVPLLLLLGRNTIFNVVSVVLSLLIVVVFLFFGIFNGKYAHQRLIEA